MKKFIISLIFIFSLGGCALTPNKTTAITAETLAALAYQLDSYEKRGWISSEDEIEMQKKILFAIDLLLGVEESVNALYCPEEKSTNSCIQAITEEVESVLRGLANE